MVIDLVLVPAPAGDLDQHVDGLVHGRPLCPAPTPRPGRPGCAIGHAGRGTAPTNRCLGPRRPRLHQWPTGEDDRVAPPPAAVPVPVSRRCTIRTRGVRRRPHQSCPRRGHAASGGRRPSTAWQRVRRAGRTRSGSAGSPARRTAPTRQRVDRQAPMPGAALVAAVPDGTRSPLVVGGSRLVTTRKLTSTDAFVVVDLPAAPMAAGVARLAPKLLVDGATWLARSQTYQFAAFGRKASGASAGVNAAADARARRSRRSSPSWPPTWPPARSCSSRAAASVADDLADLRAADPRPAEWWEQRVALRAAGIAAAAEAACGGSLDGRTVAVEGYDDSAPLVVAALTARGATIAGGAAGPGRRGAARRRRRAGDRLQGRRARPRGRARGAGEGRRPVRPHPGHAPRRSPPSAAPASWCSPTSSPPPATWRRGPTTAPRSRPTSRPRPPSWSAAAVTPLLDHPVGPGARRLRAGRGVPRSPGSTSSPSAAPSADPLVHHVTPWRDDPSHGRGAGPEVAAGASVG